MLIALIFVVALLVLVGRIAVSAYREMGYRLKRAEEQAELERRARLVYERALGLPLLNARERHNALWVRALHGDETSKAILDEMLYDELCLGGAVTPPGLDQGDSRTQGRSLH